jgi:hypothetical protein
MNQLHPWMIASWPIIERSVDSAPELAANLRHLGTTVSSDCDDYGRLMGHTMWGGIDSGVGIAWDWVETLDGVFAMSDPMGIVTNISFVDELGTGLSELMAAVQLNNITHELPWQPEVRQLTGQRRASEPWKERVRSSQTRMRLSAAYQRRVFMPDSEMQRL